MASVPPAAGRSSDASCGSPTWTRCCFPPAPATDRPHQPTYALIDLDPGGTTRWEDLLVLARLHRTAFEHIDVLARPKLTGRRGIQIWVPIERGPSFDETRDWVEQLSRTVGAVV